MRELYTRAVDQLGSDTVTPVEQAIHLKSTPAHVDLHIVPKAGHFSFMNSPPPAWPTTATTSTVTGSCAISRRQPWSSLSGRSRKWSGEPGP